MEFKNIPVAAATEIVNKYLKDEVLIITFDEKGGFTFTTDGSTEDHKANASKGAQHLISILERQGLFGSLNNQLIEDPNNRISLFQRLKRYISLRAINKKSFSKDDVNIYGKLIPVNEVLLLLEMFEINTLKRHLDEYDYLAPSTRQTDGNIILDNAPNIENIRRDRLLLFKDSLGREFYVKGSGNIPDLVDTIIGVNEDLNLVDGKKYGSFHIDYVELTGN